MFFAKEDCEMPNSLPAEEVCRLAARTLKASACSTGELQVLKEHSIILNYSPGTAIWLFV
ncbi:MAG: hypothetical protein ACYS9T_05535 [Planctomycetota bacterium]